MAERYDMVVRIAKEPTKALKAVAEPMYMHPRSITHTMVTSWAWKGLRHLLETWRSQPEAGVASSRARVQRVRPATQWAPGMQTSMLMRKRISRAVVAAVDRVACWYIAASGRETMLVLKTSSRDVIPYSIAK